MSPSTSRRGPCPIGEGRCRTTRQRPGRFREIPIPAAHCLPPGDADSGKSTFPPTDEVRHHIGRPSWTTRPRPCRGRRNHAQPAPAHRPEATEHAGDGPTPDRPSRPPRRPGAAPSKPSPGGGTTSTHPARDHRRRIRPGGREGRGPGSAQASDPTRVVHRDGIERHRRSPRRRRSTTTYDTAAIAVSPQPAAPPPPPGPFQASRPSGAGAVGHGRPVRGAASRRECARRPDPTRHRGPTRGRSRSDRSRGTEARDYESSISTCRPHM
jgi:hypothetical protein